MHRLLLLVFAVLLVVPLTAAQQRTYPEEIHRLVVERLRQRTANGGTWGEWSGWTPCSRSCGSGVSIQSRECLMNPGRQRVRSKRQAPSSSSSTGSRCVGLYKRFQLCNTQECPGGYTDFRWEQCTSFNKTPFNRRFYTWAPYHDSPDSCALNCRAVGLSFYATLNQTVIDGTRCGNTDGGKICVGGRCMEIGCDNVLGSGLRLDSCGICGGDNSTCRVISGVFSRAKMPYGYNVISTLPAGASNITIQHIRPSTNYLAMRLQGGDFFLNGNWAINTSGDYDAAGTSFYYQRPERYQGDMVTAVGPLQNAVDVMLFYQSNNPGIKYEYRLPMSPSRRRTGATVVPGAPQRPIRPDNPLNPFVPGGPASRTPPSGTPPLSVGSFGESSGGSLISSSLRMGSGSFEDQLISSSDDRSQQHLNQPDGLHRPVAAALASASRSNVSILPSSSSSSLMHLGYQNNPPHTDSLIPNQDDSVSTVDQSKSSKADNLQLSRLSESSTDSTEHNLENHVSKFPLHNPPHSSTTTFSTSDRFGQMSNYIHTPQAQTPSPSSQRGMLSFRHQTLRQKLQHSSSPLHGQFYNTHSKYRPNYRTLQSPFTGHDGRLSSRPPSVPSVSRTSSSSIGSSNGIPWMMDDHHPGYFHSPHSHSQASQLPPSPSYYPQSTTTTTHSVVAGKTRMGYAGPVNDARSTNPYGSSVLASRRRQKEEEEKKKKKRKERRGKKTGGLKSKSKHEKRRKRYEWKVVGFSSCSEPCGGGTQTTRVVCVKRKRGNEVPDKHCVDHPRPAEDTVRCNLRPCPAQWVAEEWGPCSVTCGFGVQTRSLTCKIRLSPDQYINSAESSCPTLPSLPKAQVCELAGCDSGPTWKVGEWGACSAQCGLGTRHRPVTCVTLRGRVADRLCKLDSKPSNQELCDMGSCATDTWFFSKWEERCSEECGDGVQRRRMHCSGDALDNQVTETSCNPEQRPSTTRACTSDRGCGGKWFTGPWGDCSSECGPGRRSRAVVCVEWIRSRWKVTTDVSKCKATPKPETMEGCTKSCPPQWYTSEWSQCSASCSSGVQRREVKCLNEKQEPALGCTAAEKPDTRQPCNTQSCDKVQADESASNSSVKTEEPPRLPDSTGDDINRITTGNVAYLTSKSRPLEVTSPGIETVNETTRIYYAERDRDSEVAATRLGGDRSDISTDGIDRKVFGQSPDGDDEAAAVTSLDSSSDLNLQFTEVGDEKEIVGEDEESHTDRPHSSSRGGRRRQPSSSPVRPGRPWTPGLPASASVSCIDRMKNCHLVYKARLCRLKYYNKLCCETCTKNQ